MKLVLLCFSSSALLDFLKKIKVVTRRGSPSDVADPALSFRKPRLVAQMRHPGRSDLIAAGCTRHSFSRLESIYPYASDIS